MAKRLVIGYFLASAAFSVSARAQEASQPPVPASAEPQNPAPTAADGSGFGDIIVTAQRRSDSLQRTPVSVSVLDSATLATKQISTESDLQIATPGLIVRAGQNSNALNYAIRGESLDPISDTRPGVLPYVNEVQIGGLGGSTAFYDLQSVQVLKGPQGTLFGRSSTGGAVLFTTVKPGNELGGYVSARLGNYMARYFEGAIDLPIVDDTVLLRVAGVSQDRRGFQRNLYNGQRLGEVDRKGARATLTIKPSSTLENTTVVDYLRSRGSPVSSVLYSLDPGGPIPSIALTNAQTMDDTISALAGVPGLGDGSAAAYFAAHPNVDPGGLASFLLTQQRLGPYKANVDGMTKYRGRNLVISNITTLDVAANIQIKNVFGYNKLDNYPFSDIDGSPYGIDSNDPTGKIDLTRQLSEELQLLGKGLGDNLTYTVGGYFSSERNRNRTTSDILNFPILRNIQINTSIRRSKTYAGYAQGTYNLGEAIGIAGLSATAGLRYTSERVSIQMLPDDISFSDPPAAQATYSPNQSKTLKNWSWTAGLQEQINSNLMVYVTSRHGSRSGGYNGFVKPIVGLSNVGGNGYATETATDAEIGLKFQGRLGGVPTRINLAAYNMWIKNAQRAVITVIRNTPAALTVNVPSGKVTGFELDTQINPASWLSLGGSVNYTDARYTDNLVSIQGATPVPFGTYPDAPKWSGTGFAEVSVPVNNDLTATLRGDAFTISKNYFTALGNLSPGTRLPGYALVNFRLGLASQNAGWDISATVKNAFGRTYYVGGEALGQLFQLNTAIPGEPRTFAVEARLKF